MSAELANRDAVVAELGVLRALLRRAAGDGGADVDAARHEHEAACRRLDGPSSLDELAAGFQLSQFERAVALLAAGPELVGSVAGELEAATGSARLTFGAALALLPDAHWSAVTPPAPLRRWMLVRLQDPSSPTGSPLVVDERVLHHIAGAGHPDAGLAAITRVVQPALELPATLRRRADLLRHAWTENQIVLLHGPQPANIRAVAAAAAADSRLVLRELSDRDVPLDAGARDSLWRLMERETVLGGVAWAVDLTGADQVGRNAVAGGCATLDAPVVFLGDDADVVLPQGTAVVDVPRLPLSERRGALDLALHRHGAGPPAEEVERAAGVFDLPLDDLDAAAADTAAGRRLWQACRSRGRSRFGSLAEIVEPRAGWDDLVLPDQQLAQLRALVAAVRHRTRVLDDWGFSERTARGLGTTALFAGPSGTGKTLTAEVLAHDLELDLVRVDLSQVVDKYIGETEKNLKRIFDTAEDGAAVLLFDEADTLFARRTEVRDSHDRYANLEVGYLLQRMEAFRGLALLTTNSRSTLDPAFVRRLRFIVSFPYPDAAAREAIWRRAFPPATPLRGLDPARLAAVDLPGGGIAAASLTASYLAADEDEPVGEDHVRLATRWELAKTGRTAITPPGQRR